MGFLSGGGGSPTPQAQIPVMATGIRVQSSVYGRCVSLVWGRNRVAGNLIWYGDFYSVATVTGGGGGGGGGGKGGGGCFPAGTKISVPGGFADIENLREGDEVLAFDERTLEPVTSKIVQCHYHEHDYVYLLKHEFGELRITKNHWVLNQTHTFKEIGDFIEGDLLLGDNGRWLKFVSLTPISEEPVYNFLV